jgi:hypothetical protein
MKSSETAHSEDRFGRLMRAALKARVDEHEPSEHVWQEIRQQLEAEGAPRRWEAEVLPAECAQH